MSAVPVKTKVIILVHGGVVQAIHTDAPDQVEVQVFDLDQASFETPAERAKRESQEKEYQEAIQGMTAIN